MDEVERLALCRPLLGRRAIVTGAATGIGAAATEVFVAAGARVAAIYHRSPPPESMVDSAAWHQCDMRDAAAVGATFDAIAREFGGIDVLLHAAGRWMPTPYDCSEAELDLVLETTLKATIFANQAVCRQMWDTGGRIINIGSIEGVRGAAASPVYATAKAAVHGWTRSVAQAWGSRGITVNTIAPVMQTPGTQRARDHRGPEANAALDARRRQTMPIRGAPGDPVEDLGPMLVFLAGEGSRFITGQLLAVDGGTMMLGA